MDTLSSRANVYRVATEGCDLPFSICETNDGETSALRASARSVNPALSLMSFRRDPRLSMRNLSVSHLGPVSRDDTLQCAPPCCSAPAGRVFRAEETDVLIYREQARLSPEQ